MWQGNPVPGYTDPNAPLQLPTPLGPGSPAGPIFQNGQSFPAGSVPLDGYPSNGFPPGGFPPGGFPPGGFPSSSDHGANGPAYSMPGPTSALRSDARPPSQETPTLLFNFKDVPWELVLRRIADENGMSLQITQVPPGTFTFFDSHYYTPTTALDILNDHLLPLGFILVRNQRNLILFTANSDIPENLIPFVTTTDLPRLGRNELASVAIPVHNGIVQSAEQEAEELTGPLGKVTALSSSRRILVTDTGANLRRIYDLMANGSSGSGDLPTFIHQLRNTSAEEVAKAINEFLAGQTRSDTSAIPGRPPTGPSTVPQIVVAEATTNSLLVRGTPQELAMIRDLITQLDRSPPQVVIQALLVEVELGNTDEFGVELGLQDSVLFDRSVVDNIVTVTETFTSPTGAQTTNQRIISQTAAPGFNFNNQPLGNNTSASPGTFAGQALTNFGVGRVNGDLGFGGLVLSAGNESISVLLRALAAKYQVEVLSRPQIRTLDNHEAMIQIGRQVPVVDGVSVTAVGSANPVIRQDQSGIILKVTPRISPDGLVMINVNAEKSAFQLTPGTGVPIFTDATNGNVIEAPVKDITTALTTVSMQTGQTIVLGGMITRDEITVRRKVPWLGDVPLVGELFSYKLDQNVRKELLIFLTPHIVESPLHSDSLLVEEVDRIHMPHRHAEQIHGPIPGSCPQHGHSYDPGCGACRNVAATAANPSVAGQAGANSSAMPVHQSSGPVVTAGHSSLGQSSDESVPPAEPIQQTSGRSYDDVPRNRPRSLPAPPPKPPRAHNGWSPFPTRR